MWRINGARDFNGIQIGVLWFKRNGALVYSDTAKFSISASLHFHLMLIQACIWDSTRNGCLMCPGGSRQRTRGFTKDLCFCCTVCGIEEKKKKKKTFISQWKSLCIKNLPVSSAFLSVPEWKLKAWINKEAHGTTHLSGPICVFTRRIFQGSVDDSRHSFLKLGCVVHPLPNDKLFHLQNNNRIVISL